MRSYSRLTQKDRIIIQRGLEEEKSYSEIALEMGRHRSTVLREVRRNQNSRGGYKSRGAEAYARSRKRHVIEYRRKIEGVLEEIVTGFLNHGLSPDQISQRLKLERAKWSVSHETIYRWIYQIAPDLKKCLRWKSRIRQKRSKRPRRGLGRMPRKFIDQRSQECNERREIGHWERDLLEGQRGGHALLVLQDRVTRKTKIRRVTSHYADHVNQMTIEALRGETVRSITNDNGVEFGCYADLEKAMEVPVYYCHAYTSWERGMVENTNGLLRQFFPKGFNFNLVDDEHIQMAENTINLRPRKMLGYRSADEIHEQKKMSFVRSESYYRRSMHRREDEIFKQSMIREVGFFINNNGEILLH
jgi:transposase, IS30 family